LFDVSFHLQHWRKDSTFKEFSNIVASADDPPFAHVTDAEIADRASPAFVGVCPGLPRD